MIKRLFDIMVASFLLMISFPVILLTAMMIRVKIGKPVLFTQKRPGKNEKPFRIYKFRTMTDELDESGHMLPDHLRLTPLGKFLRKFSLDEIPQLFNVLKGDISLVGPRPLLMEYLELYTPKQARRHEVKPGITGWAQVNGRNAISWEEKFKLDVWYVDNHSLLLDVKILYLTILKVFKADSINQKGHVTMDKFQGTTK